MNASPSELGRQPAPNGIDQDAEEDLLTSFLSNPEVVQRLKIKPADLHVSRFRWLLEAMLEQEPRLVKQARPYPVQGVTPPAENVNAVTFDVAQLARSMARHGMDETLAAALIAQLWSRPAGDLEELARLVLANAFRRRALLAASKLARATSPAEALKAVEAVLR